MTCRPTATPIHLTVPTRTGWALVLATCPTHAPVAGAMVGQLAAGIAQGIDDRDWTAIAATPDRRSVAGTGTPPGYWRWLTDIHDRVREAADMTCDHQDCRLPTRVVTIVIHPGRGTWITASCPMHAIWAGEWARRLALGVS